MPALRSRFRSRPREGFSTSHGRAHQASTAHSHGARGRPGRRLARAHPGVFPDRHAGLRGRSHQRVAAPSGGHRSRGRSLRCGRARHARHHQRRYPDQDGLYPRDQQQLCQQLLRDHVFLRQGQRLQRYRAGLRIALECSLLDLSVDGFGGHGGRRDLSLSPGIDLRERADVPDDAPPGKPLSDDECAEHLRHRTSKRCRARW